MSPERKREREKNAICSGHLRLCQQPRAAHVLRSDQHKHCIMCGADYIIVVYNSYHILQYQYMGYMRFHNC